MAKEFTGTCSHCHGEFDLNDLHPLPHVEEFIRNIGQPNFTANPPRPEDIHVMLCPSCLERWKEHHGQK